MLYRFAVPTLLAIFLLNAASAQATPAAPAGSITPDGKVKFSFQNAEITQVIETYSKASGQKFIVDPTVRGKISIYLPQPVAYDEAFNLLSSSLALNQFAIVESGDAMIIMSSRNAQRSGIVTLTELPPLRPEKMVSMVFTLKYISADDVNKRLRILPSKDGELTPFEPTNKIIVTDWTSNVHRIAKLIEQLDQPAGASSKKTN